ncbi:Sapep family Mn(2+)-dependent dipeptidase [Enterococcus sp. JM9B]|uniref:Sapep family Mn(2+)-dependent dipeptidase n=1 Tax=Enterococcus sp. JM9B TaxID=1857216 RepID=UPI001375228B|nr:Sapep family Mn(2+)-dependent dipeptidase [Enterococcus sp. JM9B]KAF1300956.1 peptidase M20 [Enterococcus sp. JM9B]
MDEIKTMVEQNWEGFLQDLQQVMQVPSVKGEPKEQAPYGIYPRKVLSLVLEMAENDGFTTTTIDDAIGYLQWGEGSEYIGILGHLDVVSAGEGWDYPPFDLTEDDGVLYGRGILDNKGPIMSCFYGLKLLKDSGIQPKKPVRIIFGTDEESGMSDVPHYLKAEQPPIFGFTPDCKYPVVYGERGIVNVRITTDFEKGELANLGEIIGNQARDHVPDKLSVLVDETKISVEGARAPSNAPEMGKNAITLLARRLKTNQQLSVKTRAYFDWLFTHFHEQHTGEGIDLALEDEDSGKLMLTPVILSKNENQLQLEIAFRYPVSFQEEEIVSGIATVIPAHSTVEVIRSVPGINLNKDRSEIRLLGNIYQEITGNDGTPVTTTGGTYARKLPNIVAFGPSFPGQKGIAHNKNEWMTVADLKTNMEIYMRSILALIQ